MNILFSKTNGAIVDRIDSDDVQMSGLNPDLELLQLVNPINETFTNVSQLNSTEINNYKVKKIEQLALSATAYIETDYPVTNQTSLLSLKADAGGERLTQINAIQSWIDSVLDEYYTRKSTIENASTIDTIYEESTDFSSFDASKPAYTLRTVREAANS